MATPFLKSVLKPMGKYLKAPKLMPGAGLSQVRHTEKAIKSPVIDKFVRAMGGNNPNVMKRLESDAIRGHTLHNVKSSAKKMKQLGLIDKRQAKARIAGGRKRLYGPGNRITRMARDTITDVSHPINNFRGNVIRMVRDYDPVTRTWSNKSPMKMLGSTALNVGLPASFIAPVWKDKKMNTGQKLGKSVGYAAAPLMFTKFIPSMATYSAIDKVFPSSQLPKVNR